MKLYLLNENNLPALLNKTVYIFGAGVFAKDIKKNSKVVDIGTGTGIISILLSAKSNASKIYGVGFLFSLVTVFSKGRFFSSR